VPSSCVILDPCHPGEGGDGGELLPSLFLLLLSVVAAAVVIVG